MDTSQSVEGKPLSVKVTMCIVGGAVKVMCCVAPLVVTVTLPEAGLAS